MTVKTTRRTSVKQAALAGAAGPLILSGKARGASGRKMRHAAIGVGWRGPQDLPEFVTHPDFKLVALTETFLMGTVVNRFPKEKLVWDAGALEFSNKPEADPHLRRTYRAGWHVEGLG